MTNQYKPEGTLIDTPRHQAALRSFSALQEAMAGERILEARALVCDSDTTWLVIWDTARKIPRIRDLSDRPRGRHQSRQRN